MALRAEWISFRSVVLSLVFLGLQATLSGETLPTARIADALQSMIGESDYHKLGSRLRSLNGDIAPLGGRRGGHYLRTRCRPQKRRSRRFLECQAHAATLSSRYSWCKPPKMGSARTR